jgi:elongation factor 3
VSAPQSAGTLDRLTEALDDASAPLAREGALLAIASLSDALGAAVEPFLVPVLPQLLERFADKARRAQRCRARVSVCFSC